MLKFFLVIILILFSSCAPDPQKVNEPFLQKYKSEVSRINSKRQDDNKIPPRFNPEISEQYISKPLPIDRNSLPPDMFEIKYLTENYPDSYQRFKLTFDDIKIPDVDVYGVKTGFDDKNYLLIDGQVLQRNVDYLNSATTYGDREIRLILVKEQKELDRKNIVRKKNAGEDEDSDSEDQKNDNKANDKNKGVVKDAVKGLVNNPQTPAGQ